MFVLQFLNNRDKEEHKKNKGKKIRKQGAWEKAVFISFFAPSLYSQDLTC